MFHIIKLTTIQFCKNGMIVGSYPLLESLDKKLFLYVIYDVIIHDRDNF